MHNREGFVLVTCLIPYWYSLYIEVSNWIRAFNVIIFANLFQRLSRVFKFCGLLDVVFGS